MNTPALSNEVTQDVVGALIDSSGHVEVPDSFTSVGQNAFSRTDVVSVTLGSGITSIGLTAFAETLFVEVAFLAKTQVS